MAQAAVAWEEEGMAGVMVEVGEEAGLVEEAGMVEKTGMAEEMVEEAMTRHWHSQKAGTKTSECAINVGARLTSRCCQALRVWRGSNTIVHIRHT